MSKNAGSLGGRQVPVGSPLTMAVGHRAPYRCPRLTRPPVEILEDIPLYLPGQDIIEMNTVRGVTVKVSRSFINLSAG